MELLREVRLKMGNSILSKKLGKVRRKVFYTNINRIKTIGIVWDASNPEDFNSLSKFHQKMNERGVNVTILGYYPGKELPNQYTALRYFTCLKNREISFFYVPVSNETEKFINTMFDILIDINFEKVFPVYYISSLSKASFKVGLFDKEANNSTFDLMMELKKPVRVEDYLTNVIHYLEMINSGSSGQADKNQL
ncbi:MAG: hypothetical protein A2V64_04425 [Bacteroidetes bacterium RBG_13_43_22]|nr:MAG: hypothetical protein A2V64_04425 [Bacteroidetes bacterium RBG_13_43_22]